MSCSSEAPLYYPILIAKEKVQTRNQYSTMPIETCHCGLPFYLDVSYKQAGDAIAVLWLCDVVLTNPPQIKSSAVSQDENSK